MSANQILEILALVLGTGVGTGSVKQLLALVSALEGLRTDLAAVRKDVGAVMAQAGDLAHTVTSLSTTAAVHDVRLASLESDAGVQPPSSPVTAPQPEQGGTSPS
jgi:hypothetical protein